MFCTHLYSQSERSFTIGNPNKTIFDTLTVPEGTYWEIEEIDPMVLIDILIPGNTKLIVAGNKEGSIEMRFNNEDDKQDRAKMFTIGSLLLIPGTEIHVTTVIPGQYA